MGLCFFLREQRSCEQLWSQVKSEKKKMCLNITLSVAVRAFYFPMFAQA